MPVKIDKFHQLLVESKYDTEKTNFLIDGLKNGFDIQYQGPTDRRSTSNNIPFSVGNETELWNKIMKEVKLKRVAGPFKSIPFDNYIQSPIGLVPKAGSEQTRLIFHLSYEFKEQGLGSVNACMPREVCSVKYKDLDYAVKTYLELCESVFEDLTFNSSSTNEPQSTGPAPSRANLRERWQSKFDQQHNRIPPKVIFGGKSDLKSAFRILGLSPESWKWLIMKAKDPQSEEWFYFVDKCLPFGHSISCALFQKFSDALKHLIGFKTGLPKQITNYLDDFLFIAFLRRICDQMIQAISGLVQRCGSASVNGQN